MIDKRHPLFHSDEMRAATKLYLEWEETQNHCWWSGRQSQQRPKRRPKGPFIHSHSPHVCSLHLLTPPSMKTRGRPCQTRTRRHSRIRQMDSRVTRPSSGQAPTCWKTDMPYHLLFPVIRKEDFLFLKDTYILKLTRLFTYEMIQHLGSASK